MDRESEDSQSNFGAQKKKVRRQGTLASKVDELAMRRETHKSNQFSNKLTVRDDKSQSKNDDTSRIS